MKRYRPGYLGEEGLDIINGEVVFVGVEANNATWYHYTSKSSAETIVREGFKTSDGIFGQGVYLTGDESGSGINLQWVDTKLKVSVRAEKTLEVNGFSDYRKKVDAAAEGLGPSFAEKGPHEILGKLGYDSVRVKNRGGNGKDWLVAFKPSILSAEIVKGAGGSGNYGHTGRPGMVGGSSGGRGSGGLDSADRAARARASYKPATAAAQRLGEGMESKLASAIGGRGLPDNEPFDVLKGKHMIEVKTIVRGKNDKITMHPESLRRKVKAVKQAKGTAHTVVFDARGKPPKVFYQEGLGSFRLRSMKETSLGELKAVFK